MADPNIIAAKCSIAYKSDDGYRSVETIETMQAGGDDPINVLATTVREASRLLALFGHPGRASAESADAVKAVANWRAAQAAKQGEAKTQ